MTAARRVPVRLATERRRGVSFELAWERALESIGDPTALEWAKDEWRAAYERRAGRLEALGRIEREREGPVLVA